MTNFVITYSFFAEFNFDRDPITFSKNFWSVFPLFRVASMVSVSIGRLPEGDEPCMTLDLAGLFLCERRMGGGTAVGGENFPPLSMARVSRFGF